MSRATPPQFALTSQPQAAKPFMRQTAIAVLAAFPALLILNPLPAGASSGISGIGVSAAQVQQAPNTFPPNGYMPPHGHPPMAAGQRPYPNSNRGASNATMPRPNAVPNPGAASVPEPNPAPSALRASSSALPPSVLDQPAQVAKVDLQGGKLTVHADNSSLTAIMNQVATSAGMKVDGLTRDERVFGTYGPGDPHEIISELLDGSGYNVVMFGQTSAGTPSEITLTPRGGSTATGGGNGMRMPARTTQAADDDDDSAQQTQYQDQVPQQEPPQPGPGAIAPTPPAKTPQQMLLELQQMREQQQQQQQQQAPQ